MWANKLGQLEVKISHLEKRSKRRESMKIVVIVFGFLWNYFCVHVKNSVEARNCAPLLNKIISMETQGQQAINNDAETYKSVLMSWYDKY